jgi:hypothetical protein
MGRGSVAMSLLKWDETDFLECLEVAPEIDEYETGYHYVVTKPGMRLELSVYPYASDIAISIYQDGIERPIISFQITECSGTRRTLDHRGDYLEFAPAQVFGDRFKRDYLIPVGVRLTVRPTISLELFANTGR